MDDTTPAQQVWRIYTTENGTSAMEPLDVTLEPNARGGWESRLLAGKGVILRRYPKNLNMDWHTAPRRQMIATISGAGEIQTGDGRVLALRPGVITLVEDVTGQGHITRTLGDAGRISLFLPLDEATLPRT